MKTFGLALRAVPINAESRVEEIFEKTVEEWKSTKLRDARAVSQGFTVNRVREVTNGASRLVEYLADQKADHEGRWRTSVRLFQAAEQPAWLTIEMSLDDMAERFAPAVYKVQPPRLLRNFGKELNLKTVDGWDVPRSALEVGDTGAVDHLATEILDPKRLVPLVVVTEPVFATPTVKGLASLLGEHLFGLARVVHLPSKLTRPLTARLGKELSVFDGGIRIYWPGVTLKTPPFRHPLILRRAIEQAGASAKRWVFEALTEKLIPVTTSRYREPEPIGAILRMADAEKLEESQLSQLELTERIKTLIRERDEARELEQAAYADIRKLEIEAKELEAALGDARRGAAKAEAMYDGLRRKSAAHGDAPPPPPQDEAEALEQARKAFKDTLVLPDDLTIETDLGADLYDALHAMNDAVLRERSRKMGDRQKVFSELFGQHLDHPGRYEPGPTGLKYASEDCRNRVHLKSGRPDETESIYWLERGTVEKRQYVIFRIGRHAP